MAKYKKGILGGFSGTVGTVVGSKWRGIEYMRSQATSRKSSNTPDQQATRVKFKLVAQLLGSMRDLLKIGYQDHLLDRMTSSNLALSYTVKNAVTGVFPDFSIDYSRLQVSRGALPNADVPAAVADAAGTIRYNWTNNTGIGKAKANDQSLLAAYCPELNQTVYTLGSPRSAGTHTLNVPGFSGKPVQTWISFLSEDEKDIASSLFTGQVNVA